MNEHNGDWDREVDVVVLGSGGAALVAAISAHHHGAGEVLIVEKSGIVGGTTAMSGGMLWIPLNHHSEELGIEDSYVSRLPRLPAGSNRSDAKRRPLVR
jgi:succinate dehydrogenase/fumarate reductase flavoprotein subunit